MGDGANDIGMIRESDIGVGIKGKEGLQAYNNCDVGLPSFRCMSKLLFVHGKSNEMRLQTLVLYFLYKNTLLSMITLLLSYLLSAVVVGVLVRAMTADGFYTFQFTLFPLLLCTPILLVFAWLIPVLCFRNLEKQSIVERLRAID